MLEQIFYSDYVSTQQVVDVHGHKQCVKCSINVSPFCSDEQASEYKVDDVVSDNNNKKSACNYRL